MLRLSAFLLHNVTKLANVVCGHSSRYAIQTMSSVTNKLQAVQAMQYVVAAQSDMTNPTATMADLILPQAEDVETDLGFRSIQGGFVYCPKLVQPQGESANWNGCIRTLPQN